MNPRIISLNGIWEFFYSPQKFRPQSDALPNREVFTGKMAVPGYWDDHYELFDTEDFFGLMARFNPDYRKPHFPMGRILAPHASSSFLIGSGFYRKVFEADFRESEDAVLTIGPAMWGCSVFCNGKLAGSTTGYSTATDFDIGGFLQPDKENELVIVVCNIHDDGGAYCRVDGSHDGIPFGTRPGQHRGLAAQGYQSERAGISGEVSLKITPGGRIDNWFVTLEADVLHWHIDMHHGGGKTLCWRICRNGKVFDSGKVGCVSNYADFCSSKCPAELWSDTEPVLYDLELELKNGLQRIDRAVRRWGARMVRCRGNRILLNGRPVYFRGVTEHYYFPETCNAHFDKKKYLHDLGVFKRAGFNFIRCHTWCPPEPFYDACDELGILVQTELPSVYSSEEALAVIRRIRHHPCAVIFCEGNEKVIDACMIERLKKIASLLKKEAPGMLFNPQEAMRGIEYGFTPDQKLEKSPFPHNATRLAELAKFSDLYGSLGNSFFSYFHDMFPGVEKVEKYHSIYKKPCLSHEIGILGGYLDFNLESRYEGTFIGTDLFRAARENMQKHGVWENAVRYYKTNCRFIASLRKQLVENLRSCPSITGYDYLGGIDTHWHLTGYPCGIFNEFYEEKTGESIEDVRRYTGDTVLLCSALNHRNFQAGSHFSETINISYFAENAPIFGELIWNFTFDDGQTTASGHSFFKVRKSGTIIKAGKLDFSFPKADTARCGTLRAVASADGKIWENHWTFWVFPAKEVQISNGVRLIHSLSAESVDFMTRGGTVVLTGGFPGEMCPETFRPHTSGRVFGHAGTIIHDHPLWNKFPHSGFADWQFFPMMTDSFSLVNDTDMPEFHPLLELIPSFKLITRKSLLSEFSVGTGCLIVCGLRLEIDDPGARWFKYLLLEYAGNHETIAAPKWRVENLRKRVSKPRNSLHHEKSIDAGGRPIENNKQPVKSDPKKRVENEQN